MLGEPGHRTRAGAVGHLLHHLVAQQARGGVVHLGELRRDAGLEREAAQEGRAEGVDRLDLEAARRLDGAGEEGAGMGQLVRVEVARRCRAPARSSRRAASSRMAQAPRRAKRRFCISLAAALV